MALRIDSSQNRNLYVGTGTEVAVSDGNAIITGNVGIGTTSPAVKLQITSGSNPSIKIQDTSNGYAQKNSLIFDQKTNSGQVETAKIYTELFNGASTTLNNPLKFATAQRTTLTMTDRIVIDNLGNVGIGTDSPTDDGATATTLEVRGNSGTGGGVVRVSNAGNTAAARFFAGSASATIGTVTNHDLNISTNNSLKMVVKAGGNVGIGTTSPSVKFEVAEKSLTRHTNSNWGQSAIANPNDAEVAFVWGAGGTGYPGFPSTYTRQWIAGLSPFSTGTDRWSLTNKTLGATTAITVLEDGKIGMGTTSPRVHTEIRGAGQTTANITDSGNSGAFLQVSDTGNGAGAGGGILFSATNDNSTTTPQASIKSLLTNGNGQGVGNLAFSTRAATTDTALTERMRITSAGNLQVSNGKVQLTSQPTTQLEMFTNQLTLTAGGNQSFYWI